MSNKVAARVWEHSRHRGTIKLLLITLADFANDDGICWPGAAKLAMRINETERYTRLLIKKLEDAGDLIVAPGGGRGNTTRYGIVTGLSERERTRLNSVLQNTVLKNIDTEKTVISGDENSVLQCQETVISGDEGEPPNTAQGSAKTTQKQNANHHRTIIEPLSKDHTDHQRLMAEYAKVLDYRLTTGPQEAAAAKKILAAGYTVEQALEAYATLKADAFWQGKHLSLQTVYKQMGAILATSKAKQNGARQPNTKRSGYTPPATEWDDWTSADPDKGF